LNLRGVQKGLELHHHILESGPQLGTGGIDYPPVPLCSCLEYGKDRGPLSGVARLDCSLQVLDEPAPFTQPFYSSHSLPAECTGCERADNETDKERSQKDES
jgi:hypothetical protein